MREIKFRVWDKQECKFVCCHQQGLRFTLDTGQIYVNGTNFTDQYVLCQYTGLKDKNGVEIYEGDILKVTAAINGHHEKGAIEIVVVTYYMGNACFSFANYQKIGTAIFPALVNHGKEVIGNIHENPELLEDL